MGFFDSIGKILQPLTKPVGSAVDSIAGNISDSGVGNLFDSKGSLLRALANPADPIALGQTFNRTAQGDSPTTIIRDSDGQARYLVKQVGYAHQGLFDAVEDGLGEVWHGISSGWHSFFDEVGRAWEGVGGKHLWNRAGAEISHTVDKLGGEQRVVGWVVFAIGVVIYILISLGSFGTLTPAATVGLVALAGAMTTYGAQAGLAPRSAPKSALALAPINNIDDSSFTSIAGNAGSSQDGSGFGGLFGGGGLANLAPIALVGVAVAGAVGLWYLLKR